MHSRRISTYGITLARKDLGGPVEGEELGLLQDCLGGFLLLVRRIAVLAQDALDDYAQMRADLL